MDSYSYFGNLISNHRFIFQQVEAPKPLSQETQKVLDEALDTLEKAALETETSKKASGETIEETVAKSKQAMEEASKKMGDVLAQREAKTTEGAAKASIAAMRATGERIGEQAVQEAREAFAKAEGKQAGKIARREKQPPVTEIAFAEAEGEKITVPSRKMETATAEQRAKAREAAIKPEGLAKAPEAIALSPRQKTIFDAIAKMDRPGLQKFVEKLDLDYGTKIGIGLRLDQGEGFGKESTNADIAKMLAKKAETGDLMEALKPQVISALEKELNSVTDRKGVQTIAEKYGVSGFLGFGGTAEISRALDNYDADRPRTLKKVAEIIARRGDEDKLSKLMKLT